MDVVQIGWQGAIPGDQLATQCNATICLQRWWRQLRLEREEHASEEENWLTRPGVEPEDLRPLAFLSLADIGQLQAVSLAHTEALCGLGFHTVVYGKDDVETVEVSEDSVGDGSDYEESDYGKIINKFPVEFETLCAEFDEGELTILGALACANGDLTEARAELEKIAGDPHYRMWGVPSREPNGP